MADPTPLLDQQLTTLTDAYARLCEEVGAYRTAYQHLCHELDAYRTEVQTLREGMETLMVWTWHTRPWPRQGDTPPR